LIPALRIAVEGDIPALKAIMARAIHELQQGFLTPEQIAASQTMMGLDAQLIADATYFIVEDDGVAVGCGGWSRRATRYGGGHSPGRSDRLLDAATEPAKVRAMYTDPGHVRRGIGRMILAAGEAAARAEGFARVELVATLAGEPLYRACGYAPVERFTDNNGAVPVPMVLMTKALL
jgi:GNAT superfamily N-acetyltransferase